MVVVGTPASATAGDLVGTEVTTLSPGAPDVIHRWSLDAREQVVSNDASEGTFTLTFTDNGGDEETTGPIAYNANAATVDAAITALSAVTVNVAVSGNNPWTVTFPNPQRPIYAMQATDSFNGTGSTTIDAHRDLPLDPTGIAYVGGGRLVIADSEIDGLSSAFYSGHNLWEFASSDGQEAVSTDSTPAASDDPNGLAYNSSNGHLFISDGDAGRVFDVNASGNVVGSITGASLGIGAPRDVAWDSSTGSLFIAGSTSMRSVDLGGNGQIGGDDVNGPLVDLSDIVLNIEGLAYRAATDTILLTDVVPGTRLHIKEITKDGRLIRTYQAPFMTFMSDVEVGPGSSGGTSVYVVDPRTFSSPAQGSQVPIDGRFYEVAIPFSNLRPYVNAGANKTVEEDKPLTLTGDAYDDDQSQALSLTWSKVSGPGNVSFGNSSALSTTATFTEPGVYSIRLSSSDGSYSNTDNLSVTVTAASNGGNGGGDTFVDDDGSTFEADIEWMAASGITKGCNPPTNDRFCPDDYVTRGQMAAFLVRALGYTAGGNSNLFIDDDGNTFETDINRLGTAGVTKGCNPPTNNRYCPDDYVTRGQMAAFIHRAMES